MLDNNIKIFDAHMHFIGRFKKRDESIIQFMDRYGIDKALITSVNEAANLKAILSSNPNEAENEFLEKFMQKKQYDHENVLQLVKSNPERLFGVYWFNPRIATDEDWDLLRKYIVDYKFRGVKTQCYVDMLKVPSDFIELAKFCIDLDIPLFVHSGSGFFFQKTVRVKDYFRLAKKFKELKLVILHAAYNMEYVINCLRYFARNKDTPNVYFETSVSVPYGIMTLIKAIGSKRVIFGSDSPAATPPDIEIKKITCLGLEEEILHDVFYNNIARLMDIK
ncbi:MAG: amidohydrolase family protein [Promethearchaeia archaeon]